MSYAPKTVDIIIPTFKPDDKFIRLIELLEKQTVKIQSIRIVNTEKKYWDSLISKNNIESRYGNINVKHIATKDFDHGKTRAEAVSESDAAYVVLMTQDALPYDESLIENLIAPLASDESVAASYARQLSNPDATETEKYIRSFNYPKESQVKSKKDIDRLRIKTYFCSNVCAAYNHEIYDKQGGFVTKTIFNEDMIYAGNAVEAGFKIAYAADAKVYHSHNYTCMQQLHRNFDLAVSQAEHPEIFDGLKSEGEGFKLVKSMVGYLGSIHKLYLLPGFVMNCAFRYLGFRLGKNYNKIPKPIIMKLTSNKAYWK